MLITQCLNSQIVFGLFSFISECVINVKINQVTTDLNWALGWSIFRTRVVSEIFVKLPLIATIKWREMMLMQTTCQKCLWLIWNERLCLLPHILDSSMSASPERPRIPETSREYPYSRFFRTCKAKVMMWLKRGIWAQTRQWLTAKVSCLIRMYRFYGDSHGIQAAPLLLKSLVTESHHHLSLLILLHLATRLEHTTTSTKHSFISSPLQGDKQKVWNWISFATCLPVYYPLAQRKNIFF